MPERFWPCSRSAGPGLGGEINNPLHALEVMRIHIPKQSVTFHLSHVPAPMAQSSTIAPNALEHASIRGATVTTEDGGRLNAFATEPRMEVVSPESGWGFHERAERPNGRMAMLGFIALLATEFALGGEAFALGLPGLG